MEAAGNEGYLVVAGLRLEQALLLLLLLLRRKMGGALASLIRWNDKAGHGPQARRPRLIHGEVQPKIRESLSQNKYLTCRTVHSEDSETFLKPRQDKRRLGCTPGQYAPSFGWQLDLSSVPLS